MVGVRIEGESVRTFRQLADLVTRMVQDDATRFDWAGPAIGMGTVNAFVRRLQARCVTSSVSSAPESPTRSATECRWRATR